jgi:hypothetical protein
MSLIPIYSESTPIEIFIPDDIAKVKTQEKLSFLFEVWKTLLKLQKSKKFLIWKTWAFDDSGISIWLKILKQNLSQLFLQRSKTLLQKKHLFFLNWKSFCYNFKSESLYTQENHDKELTYQSEIQALEVKINSCQLKTDELTKLHAHLAARETSFKSKLEKSPKNFWNDLPYRAATEEIILSLQDENFSLDFQVRAAEFCLKDFLQSFVNKKSLFLSVNN